MSDPSDVPAAWWSGMWLVDLQWEMTDYSMPFRAKEKKLSLGHPCE